MILVVVHMMKLILLLVPETPSPLLARLLQHVEREGGVHVALLPGRHHVGPSEHRLRGQLRVRVSKGERLGHDLPGMATT